MSAIAGFGGRRDATERARSRPARFVAGRLLAFTLAWALLPLAAAFALTQDAAAPAGSAGQVAALAYAEYACTGVLGSNGNAAGQFMDPAGVAVDGAGNLYVADRVNRRIQKFTSQGAFVRQWGGSGTAAGKFNDPEGIAVDRAGNVYVADTWNHRIQKFTTHGAFVAAWGWGQFGGNANGQFYFPRGVAVDAAGYVYVADTDNHRIQKFTSQGAFVKKWGSGVSGPGAGQFDHPQGIAVDNAGYVYVADTDNERIQKFTSQGVFVTQWGSDGTANGQFNVPTDVAVDAVGNVYVADAVNDRIQQFTAQGTFVTKWSDYQLFAWLDGIAVWGGNVYVTNGRDNRVLRFTPTKTALTLTAPASCAYGGPATLSGTLKTSAGTPIPGRTVSLQYSTDGVTWKAAWNIVTSAAGGFTAKVAPTRKTYYRVRFAATGYPSCVSPTRSILPRVYLTVPTAPAVAYRNTAFTSYGFLKPKHTAGTYPVQIMAYQYVRQTNGTYAWVWRKNVTARAYDYLTYTKYQASLSLPYAGSWRITARHLADTTNSDTYAGVWKYLTVR
jgi:sugar lactone lactonase YvrE